MSRLWDDVSRAVQAAESEMTDMPREHTPNRPPELGCDWTGCDRHLFTGAQMYRVSKEGEPIRCLCREHFYRTDGGRKA